MIPKPSAQHTPSERKALQTVAEQVCFLCGVRLHERKCVWRASSHTSCVLCDLSLPVRVGSWCRRQDSPCIAKCSCAWRGGSVIMCVRRGKPLCHCCGGVWWLMGVRDHMFVSCSVLCCAVLCCAVLCCAVLCCAAQYSASERAAFKVLETSGSSATPTRHPKPALHHTPSERHALRVLEDATKAQEPQVTDRLREAVRFLTTGVRVLKFPRNNKKPEQRYVWLDTAQEGERQAVGA